MSCHIRLFSGLLCCVLASAVLAEGGGKWACKAGAGGWDCNWGGQGPAPEPEKVEKKTYPEYQPKPQEAAVGTSAGIESQGAGQESSPGDAAGHTSLAPTQEGRQAPKPKQAPVRESAWDSALPGAMPAQSTPVKADARPKPADTSGTSALGPAATLAVEDDIDEAPAVPETQTPKETKASAIDKVKSWFGTGEPKAKPAAELPVEPQPVSQTKAQPKPASNWDRGSAFDGIGLSTSQATKSNTESIKKQALEPEKSQTASPQTAAPQAPRSETPPAGAPAKASDAGVIGTVKSWFGMGESKPGVAAEQPPPPAQPSANVKRVQAIQIHASANRAELDAIKNSHTFEKQAWILTESRNSAPWYCLMIGPYADLYQALNAIEVLPNSLQQYSPWARRVEAP